MVWKKAALDGYSKIEEDIVEEEVFAVEKRKIKMDKSVDDCYVVSCNDEHKLSKENILKNLSVMKGKLMTECTSVPLKRIDCYMTPAVKNNIITAHKRLAMYGKQLPFIPRYDSQFRRLPDKIQIDTLSSMIVNIVDPAKYGEYYLEFIGVLSL